MVSAGPACSLATVPTRTYTPAPIVAPTPDEKGRVWVHKLEKKNKYICKY